jgi:hypothetical protein
MFMGFCNLKNLNHKIKKKLKAKYNGRKKDYKAILFTFEDDKERFKREYSNLTLDERKQLRRLARARPRHVSEDEDEEKR